MTFHHNFLDSVHLIPKYQDSGFLCWGPGFRISDFRIWWFDPDFGFRISGFLGRISSGFEGDPDSGFQRILTGFPDKSTPWSQRRKENYSLSVIILDGIIGERNFSSEF